MFTTVELKLQILCNFTFYIVDIEKTPSGVFFLSPGTLINNNVEMILQHTHIGEIK